MLLVSIVELSYMMPEGMNINISVELNGHIRGNGSTQGRLLRKHLLTTLPTPIM